jgi:hypothetical protein
MQDQNPSPMFQLWNAAKEKGFLPFVREVAQTQYSLARHNVLPQDSSMLLTTIDAVDNAAALAGLTGASADALVEKALLKSDSLYTSFSDTFAAAAGAILKHSVSSNHLTRKEAAQLLTGIDTTIEDRRQALGLTGGPAAG